MSRDARNVVLVEGMSFLCDFMKYRCGNRVFFFFSWRLRIVVGFCFAIGRGKCRSRGGIRSRIWGVISRRSQWEKVLFFSFSFIFLLSRRSQWEKVFFFPFHSYSCWVVDEIFQSRRFAIGICSARVEMKLYLGKIRKRFVGKCTLVLGQFNVLCGTIIAILT